MSLEALDHLSTTAPPTSGTKTLGFILEDKFLDVGNG